MAYIRPVKVTGVHVLVSVHAILTRGKIPTDNGCSPEDTQRADDLVPSIATNENVQVRSNHRENRRKEQTATDIETSLK